MKHKVTIRDLAKAAGVSVTTVSQILNGKGQRFSQATQQRVLELRDQMNYVPDFNARNLIMRSSKTIGVLVPNIGNPFFSTFIRGVQEAARQAKFMPLIFSANHEEKLERYYLGRLIERAVDGLIIASSSITTDTIEQLLKPNDIPYLLFDQNEANGGDRLLIDDYQGGYLAAEHLAGLGHQHVVSIMPENMTDNLNHRLRGLIDGLRKHHVDFNEQTDVIYGELTKHGGYSCTKGVLEEHPTAVFAANDEMAIGLYRGLAENGVSVPDDISVVGFDDIDLAEYVTPKLTTIQQPIREIGEQATEMLFNRIKNPDAAIQTSYFGVKLVVRDSTKQA